MRKILSSIVLNSISLYFTSLLFNGLKVNGGMETYITGGFLLTIGDFILRPIFKIITLPISIATLGLSSAFINSIILFNITFFYSKISISKFTFDGMSIFFVYAPPFSVNLLLSYIIISATIYTITHFLMWLSRN